MLTGLKKKYFKHYFLKCKDFSAYHLYLTSFYKLTDLFFTDLKISY